MRRDLTVLIFILVLSFGAGCSNKSAGAPGVIVAKIGSYELTAGDFSDEARLTSANKNLSEDAKKAKEELLEEVIVKKLILQEAQKQNFDKDRAFMKEIERYWEQALIKLMIRKKTEEFSRSVVVAEREVRDEYERLSKETQGNIGPFDKEASDIKDYLYNRKMRKSFDDWLMKLRAGSNVTIYEDRL